MGKLRWGRCYNSKIRPRRGPRISVDVVLLWTVLKLSQGRVHRGQPFLILPPRPPPRKYVALWEFRRPF